MIEELAVPEALQKSWAFHGARMSARETYRGQTYFLADGGPHRDAKGIVDDQDKWMEDGYYVSAWGLLRGKAVIGRPCYFKIDHDITQTEKQRKGGRLGAARADARESIDIMLTAGLLE